jgi:hypothetical protein
MIFSLEERDICIHSVNSEHQISVSVWECFCTQVHLHYTFILGGNQINTTRSQKYAVSGESNLLNGTH